MNSVFPLHALAAWKMLRQRKIRCGRTAGKPAIRAECSKDQRSNSHQTADKALFRCRYANGRFRNNTFGEQATAVVSVVHKKTMAPLHDYKFVFSGRSVRKSWLSPLAPLMPPGHEMKHKPAADHANSRLL
ncbi:hypothetical protein [Thalassobacter stenotrophicus]|uniref:hypothetical protein n=1 Tax=Thalassobacter stenotrophicus TaxID=266809 RepID=UPI00126A433D|nr:hypothetical protein [Thalassobacter stenotrophicus]